MKYTVKGRSGIVVGVVALLVVAFSFVSSLARRIGVVEPRVRIEREAGEDATRAATVMRLHAVHQVMAGEVSSTADRLREACALASGASLLAVSEKKATGATLFQKLTERKLLPPGATLTDRANVIATASSSLILHFRSVPLGVEVVSIAKDKRAGPALIVRVAGDIPRAEGMKVWASTRLDQVQLPRPFAAESEVIAAGWQAETLPSQ
jgi:Na+-transporting methylmalonyl-CoA/oxaloacetate decarboxylase gamma subunit